MTNDNDAIPVSSREVAQHFGVSIPTVRRWVRENRVPCIRISRRVVRFYIDQVEAALSCGKGVAE